MSSYAAKTRSVIPFIRSKSHQYQCACHNFSTISKTRKKASPKPRAPPHSMPDAEIPPSQKGNYSLFNEIVEISGSGTLIFDRTPSLNFLPKESTSGVADECVVPGQRPQCVRQNADDKSSVELRSDIVRAQKDAQMGISNGVSPVVEKIMEIVRDENTEISMEKRLDDGGFEIDSDIVQKVLKRCFKLSRRAVRFFDWVKLRNGGCCSTEVYNTILYIAGEAEEFGLVENLTKEMEERKCPKDVKTWMILIMHYGKAQLIGKALMVLDKMRLAGCEPDAEVYRLMIRSLSSAGEGELAHHFYKEMVQKELGQELDRKSYQVLLNCLAGNGDIDGVYSVADGMIKASEIPENEVYSCVLKSFCISKRMQEALKLIRDLRGKNFAFTRQHFETLVKGLCMADRIDDAMEIAGIMKGRGMVDEKVYGTIIVGLLKNKDISKALGLFYNMKESGILPATSTYTELMHYHFSLNEYEKGIAMFDEMVGSGADLDHVAFMPMITAYVRENRVSLAWKVFESMEDRGIKATHKSYSIFIKELCKTSRTDEVFKVLNKMQESMVAIGDDIFKLIISYLEQAGKIVEAEEVKGMQRLYGLQYPIPQEASNNDASLEETQNGIVDEPKRNPPNLLVPQPGKDFNVEDLHDICIIFSPSKNWHAMERDLQKLKVSYTPSLVKEILHACSLQGAAVLQFFSWVRKQPGYSHNSETYNMAIKIAGRGKDFEHMRSLFHEMQRNGCLITSNTWTIMIMSYGRVGLTDIALRNFVEMKASGIKPTGSTYKYLILALCGKKRGKVDEAIKLFDEMITVGLVPDKELVEVYLDCLCRSGKLVEARRCVKSLGKVGFTVPLCYSLLIRPLCRQGMLEEALALAEEVKKEDHQSTLQGYICGSLIHGLLQRGRLEEALAKLESMKRLGIHATPHIYTSLVVHFFKENQSERALDIFRKMWEEDCHPTIVTYTALICGLLNAGYFDDAQVLIRRIRIKGPLPDFTTYSKFIAKLCDVGRSEYALQLLSEMLDDGIVPSNVNFRTVFFGLNREGKQHLARIVMQQKQALIRRRKFRL